MRLVLTERFQADIRSLAAEERDRVFEVMLTIPKSMGDVHAHSGLSIRKIHRSGIWEARVGLSMRLVFTHVEGFMTFVRVGTDSDIARFLRDL